MHGNLPMKIQPKLKSDKMCPSTVVRHESDNNVGTRKCSHDESKSSESIESRHENSNPNINQSNKLDKANSNPTQNSEAFENLSSEISFYRYLSSLFTHKCLNELETCKIHQELIQNIQSGACFQPFYMTHLKSVPDWKYDEQLFEPAVFMR
uniref:Uncharacterized protein n=1 Tax=Cacopsylla melanoneura TaxID=428564 RepID=A0A8D9FHR5_9HEMI